MVDWKDSGLGHSLTLQLSSDEPVALGAGSPELFQEQPPNPGAVLAAIKKLAKAAGAGAGRALRCQGQPASSCRHDSLPKKLPSPAFQLLWGTSRLQVSLLQSFRPGWVSKHLKSPLDSSLPA